MARRLRRATLLALALSCVTNPGIAGGPDTPDTRDGSGQQRYTNRLIRSANPYLLLHAHNPVDWYPWGPEALARAKKENRPIFLSVGYSTCYWCHVAEETLYSRPEIAAMMNAWFVNIKVDREQRPDLDHIYMLATQLMTGHGGWPNNVFLTPDLKPFYAGSYFGPADAPGRPGFPTVLKALHEVWTIDEARARDRAERVFQAMQQVQEEGSAGRGGAAVRPDTWLEVSRQALLRVFDPANGGFSRGSGPKFPQEPFLALLLADYRLTRSADSLRMLEHSLTAMATGGVYDQLAGGFHRYSTEPTWSIPHFEKMLYDNAQLLAIYAHAYELTKNPLFRRIARGLSDYLAGQMLSPGGGFYSAQDAEVNGQEGASYVWTRAEVASILEIEGATRFFRAYELAPVPRPGGTGQPAAAKSGVLRIRRDLMEKPPPEIIESLDAVSSLRTALLAARNRRPQPLRDEKIIVGINGLAIDAFVQSSRIFRHDRDLDAARRTAERIWTLAYDSKTRRLKHEIFHGRAQTDAYLEDYALLGGAFLSLYDATKKSVWRDRAAALADDLARQFLREDGRLATSPNETQLLLPPRDDGDHVYPSGTSAAVDLLLRLGGATADPRHAALAARIVRHIGAAVEKRPESWGAMVATLSVHGPGLTPLDTASHVRVTASIVNGTSHDEIMTTLRIDEGWHVNANPASFDYLIPTSVSFDGVSPVEMIYPTAVRITPQFAPDGLDVYAGVANLIARFPKGVVERAGRLHGTLTVQACSNQVCLPPAQLPVAPDRAKDRVAR